MTPRLLERYRKELCPSIMQKFGLKNKLQVPRLKKIVVNMGVGAGAHDIKVLEEACQQLALIAGQRPIITKAHKAISNFKIRKGSPVGCKVTLRGVIMYEFLDRLISVALPRIRDFRGFPSNSFDNAGNYSLGLNEQTVFPEIDIDKVQRLQGMDVTIVMEAKSRALAFELLKAFGFPFTEKSK
ncbi:MAG: 50S ribosomal protein L5 [Candidatus Omnitrophica bacterium]|nr:50S ribosomal protein L5 [Candidatus Omnitrophota bacterium]